MKPEAASGPANQPGGLPYRWLTVAYRVVDGFRLDGYTGFAVRGAFGHALKAATCRLPGTACPDCSQPVDCPYLRLFETPAALEQATRFVRNNQPHPYLILPQPVYGGGYASGEQFSFQVLFMGGAVEAMGVILAALHELGRQGMGSHHARLELEQVQIFTGWDWSTCLPRTFPHADILPMPLTVLEIPSLIPHNLSRVELVTVTPLRVQQAGMIVGEGNRREELRFETLITTLLGRLNDLWNLYGDTPLHLDIAAYRQLAREIQTMDNNLTWNDRTRHSMRQGRRPTGGLEGRITFAGDLTPFFPWLVLGERLHVGKSSSFGYGKYRLGWY